MSVARGRWLLLASVWLALNSAQAVTLEGLYESQVVVTGQGPEERQRGLRQALEDVLVKLSGDSTLPASGKASDILSRAESLVRDYRYEPRIKGQIHDEQGTRERPFILHIAFNAAALEQAMRGADIPIWRGERPQTLIWLAIQDMVRQYVLGSEGEFGRGQREVLLSVAQRRGVPIRLPAMDPQDQAAIGYADISSEHFDRIREASKRYDIGAILSGSLRYDGAGGWSMHWVLQREGRVERWQLTGVTFDVALAAGVEGLARSLSEQSDR